MNAQAHIHRPIGAPALSPEAEPIYLERLRDQRHETNGVFFWLMLAQWAFALVLATFVSPRAWAGLSSSIHPHFWAALLGGGLLTSAPLIFIRARPDAALTRHIVALSQMLFSALFIHLTGGRIETHFHVFGSLAILAFYLDRWVLLTATAVVIFDHLLRGMFLPQSVYGVAAAGWWRSLEHGGWVIFEIAFLVHFTQRGVNRTLGLAAEAAATQQALQDGEHRLRLVIDTAYDAYVAMDAEGKIADWNARAEKTFGWTREEAIGHLLSERIIPAELREAFQGGLGRLLENGESAVLSRQTELMAMDRDGREFPIDFTISAVRWGGTHLFNAFMRDITERQEHERQQEEMHRRLVETSRQAGKAEVAVGVLHNVGNVLNSVNVSAGIINDTIRGSQVGALGEVVSLLRAQNGGLANFLTEDPRGRLVPELLGRLADGLRAEHAKLTSETGSLVSHVGHIRETVALQQNYASVAGVMERLAATVLLEDALQLEGAGMVRHGIEIAREWETVQPVLVDRHKTLQILVNLLRNAKQAMAENKDRGKRLVLGISRREKGPVCISIQDNGVGITPENLSRIFGHGFTTKENGHGFGLHISALAAGEMGGALKVHSGGPGMGAVFTLELPPAPSGETAGLIAIPATVTAPAPPATTRTPHSNPL